MKRFEFPELAIEKINTTDIIAASICGTHCDEDDFVCNTEF